MERYLLDGEEFAIVDSLYVSCDGNGAGALGHPIEYLTLERGGEAVCKYCDRHFLHHSHPRVSEVRAQGEPIDSGGDVASPSTEALAREPQP